MKEIISESYLNKFKELIERLGKIEIKDRKEIFSIPIESNKDSKLRILLKNEETNQILGLLITLNRQVYSQKFFLNEDPKDRFIDLINLGKIANYLIEEILGKDKQIYKDLSNRLKSNSLELIGKWYPEHRKSLIKFRIEESEAIETLSIGYNRDRKEIKLLINLENYIKIALTEVLILGMKRFKKFKDNIQEKEFNQLLTIYGSLLLLHELYHVLHRHIYDNYSEQLSSELENLIMDEYINSKLIYLRFNRYEVRDLLKLLGLKTLEINSGIGTVIYFNSKLRKDLVKIDKYTLSRLIYYFRELKPVGFDQLIQFLDNCSENDRLFVAIQNLDYLNAFDSFSTPIRKFVKEFLDLTKEDSIIPEELNNSNSLEDKLSDDSNFQERNESGEDKLSEEEQQDNNSGNGKDSTNSNNINGNIDLKEISKDDLKKICNDSFIDSILEIPDELLDDILVPVAKEIFNNDFQEGIKFDKIIVELMDKITEEDKLEIKVDWRDKLELLIEEASGINFIYNPDGQNRRYEGQVGRLELVPAIENIILSFDISGSMTTEDYKVIINYVEDLIRRFNIGEFQIDSSCNIGYVYWAGLNQGNEYVVQPSPIISSDKIFDIIKSYEKEAKTVVGFGTDFGAFIRPFESGKLKGFVPDLMIVFTDGEFLDLKTDSRLEQWYLENKDKIIFVLTTDEYENILKSHDSTYIERTIIFKKNL